MNTESENKPAISIWLRVWHFFSSVRLALVLILILVALSLTGIFIIQVPAGIKSVPGQYDAWLQNVAQPQTGFWFLILKSFNLFDVFHSVWFLGAGVLLILSIIICSLSRLKQTRLRLSFSDLRQEEKFYKTGNSRTIMSGNPSPGDAGDWLTRILKKRHYHVRTGLDENTGDLHIAADKNRFSPLGIYFIHLSLILLIAGYLLGSFTGFRDNSFTVPVDATRDIGNNTGLSLQLQSFTDDYWPDGSPKDYRSTVSILKNNRVVETGLVRVNHPLNYQGIRIYQSYFGPAVQIQISDTGGKVLYQGNIALDGFLNTQPFQRPVGEFNLTQEGYIVFIAGRAANIEDTVLTSGQVGIEVYRTSSNTPLLSTKADKGTPVTAGSIQLTYLGDTRFSGFQISRDPGNNLIWIASGLFLLGLLIVFYFPRRHLWALIQQDPEKGLKLWLRTDTAGNPGNLIELENVSDSLTREIEPADENLHKKEK